LLKITWDFGDGTPTKTITNYVNNPALAGNLNYNTSANANHTYSSSGRYLVTLTADEMDASRGQRNSKEIFVNVFSAGINVFPVISSPIGVIDNRTINFNASRSFVANCSTLSCPACPLKIENGKLNCTYIHKPGNKSVGNYDLNMDWTIEDSSDIEINGSWSSNYSEVVDFSQYLEKSDNKTVTLVMEYTPTSGAVSTGETSNSFSINQWYCDNGVWRKPGSASVSNNCSKYVSYNDGAGCCPDYNQCNQNGSCSGYVKYCYEYKNEFNCKIGTPFVVTMNNVNFTCGASSLNGSCRTTNTCSCKWNSTATIKCQDVFNIVKTPSGCDGGGGSCTWSSDIINNQCNNSNNYVEVTKRAFWSGTDVTRPAECEDVVRRDICPITAKLPFFGDIMMFISVCLIAAVYLFKGIKKEMSH
jgi:hypothetical protein